MSEAQIDYSRPVGWWCDVCGWESLSSVRDKCHCKSPVASLFWGPVYLPIPEGQRPPAASEVEEAEVVTVERDVPHAFLASVDAECVDDETTWLRSTAFVYATSATAKRINRIAQASARARIVTGATE